MSLIQKQELCAGELPQVIQSLYFQRVGLQKLLCLVKGLKSLCQFGLRATKSSEHDLTVCRKMQEHMTTPFLNSQSGSLGP